MKHRKLRNALVSVVLVFGTQTASAININLDFSFDTNNFFGAPNSVTILQDAAAFFEQAISDDLLAINSGGSNSYDASFFHPGTGAIETINDFSVAADTITIFVGGMIIPGDTIGLGGSGGFSCSGIVPFCTNAATRGEGAVSDVQGPTATEIAPWGGSISFDTSATWYFDADTSTDEAFAGSDFFSTALHEIGHVLGFGGSDSWFNLVDSLNLEFLGAASMASFGGAVPLDIDEGHWAAGTMSAILGVPQEAAMDPDITNGARKRFTDLDVAALNDVGWEATTIPLPGALPLFVGALFGLFGLRRRGWRR